MSRYTNLRSVTIGCAAVAAAGVVAVVIVAIIGFHCLHHHQPLDCYHYYCSVDCSIECHRRIVVVVVAVELALVRAAQGSLLRCCARLGRDSLDRALVRALAYPETVVVVVVVEGCLGCQHCWYHIAAAGTPIGRWHLDTNRCHWLLALVPVRSDPDLHHR